MNRPLYGIKVLELSTFVAAPSCTRLLSDLGATVIKVEHPDGDLWRKTSISYCPGRFSEKENPVFDLYNTGKKHIAINLKTEGGMAVFEKLLSESDVFVTNTREEALKRLGISYSDLSEKYPKLIYASVLGYGENGPDAKKPAFDTTAFWARSGFLRDMSIRKDDYFPVAPPYGVGDTVTGMFLMGEVCAALFRRERTGKGDYVRSGLYHNGIFSMGIMNITTQKPFGTVYPRTRLDFGSPGGMYLCADGEWVYLAISYGPKMLPSIYKAMDLEWLATDERFADPAERFKNREAYYNIFKDKYLTKTSAEWIKIFEEEDLPLMVMNHFSDVSEDEQAWANGYLEKVEFESGNVNVMPSSPVEMDSVGEIKTVPAGAPFSNTEEILTSLGYTPSEIEALGRDGCIRTE